MANSASRYVRGVAFSQAWGSYRSHQEEERSFHRSPARRYDEPPTGYSSAGCSPAVPASASPAGCYSETRCRPLSIGTQIPLDTASQFQRCASPRLPVSQRRCSWLRLMAGVTLPIAGEHRRSFLSRSQSFAPHEYRMSYAGGLMGSREKRPEW